MVYLIIVLHLNYDIYRFEEKLPHQRSCYTRRPLQYLNYKPFMRSLTMLNQRWMAMQRVSLHQCLHLLGSVIASLRRPLQSRERAIWCLPHPDPHQSVHLLLVFLGNFLNGSLMIQYLVFWSPSSLTSFNKSKVI